MNGAAETRGWCANLCLLAAVGAALAHLPTDQIPAAWLLAFLVPAAGLGLSGRRPGSAPGRALLGILLQIGACWGAYELAGAMDQKAALACTILPPMAFVTMRRQDADAALGLFLSFCTLLVGTILGSTSLPLLGLYVAATTVVLRCDARRQALGQQQRTAPANLVRTAAPLVSGLLLAVCCAATAFTVTRSLELLPSPVEDRRPARSESGGSRGAGLADRFVLDGGGQLVDLQGDRLLLVAARGRPVPGDLYLRSGFFDVAGLDAWGMRPFASRRRDTIDRDLRLRAPLPGAVTITLEIERLANARNFVFVPPGTHAIRGIDAVQIDGFREWFRQQPGRTSEIYEVMFQDLPPPRDDHVVDPRGAANGLLELPPDLDRAPFDLLLADWQPRGSPLAKATRIIDGLQALCAYRREEPVGPHRHALLNFLFADQGRHGYCMHFASAAALLLRMSGVPCRIGVGLFGGEPDPHTAGGRVFGSQHAHAWVEIPFAGRGFAIFDPTPPAERGVRAPAALPHPAETGTAGDGGATTTGSIGRWIASTLSQPWPWAALLAVAALLTIRRGQRRRRESSPGEREARPARKLLLQILSELEHAGLPRARGETLELYLGQPLLREAPADLRAAFTVYQEIRFGGRTWNAANKARMVDGLTAAVRMRGQRVKARS